VAYRPSGRICSFSKEEFETKYTHAKEDAEKQWSLEHEHAVGLSLNKHRRVFVSARGVVRSWHVLFSRYDSAFQIKTARMQTDTTTELGLLLPAGSLNFIKKRCGL
jgi:hypothetical protein